jgi:hypothetical protein
MFSLKIPKLELLRHNAQRGPRLQVIRQRQIAKVSFARRKTGKGLHC